MNKSLLLASILGMASNSFFDESGIAREFTRREKLPKNKYSLTPEQILEMKEMTPKQKKSYLRNIAK